jgi:AcrR family transcriptional regulator
MARGERSDTTRTALLGAGARVFTRRGLYGATIREIVQEAGFTAPVLYYHFHDKQALYVELIRAGARRYWAILEEELDGTVGAIDRLRGFARAGIRFGNEDRNRLRVLYAEIFGPRGPRELKLGLDELRARSIDFLEEILAFGKRSGEIAVDDVARARRLFGAILSGLLVEQALQPEVDLLDSSLADDVVRLFLDGMRTSKGSS